MNLACTFVGLLLYKNLDPDSQKANWEDFFVWACLSVSIISGLGNLSSLYNANPIPRGFDFDFYSVFCVCNTTCKTRVGVTCISFCMI